jgi:hypothetical protein
MGPPFVTAFDQNIVASPFRPTLLHSIEQAGKVTTDQKCQTMRKSSIKNGGKYFQMSCVIRYNEAG